MMEKYLKGWTFRTTTPRFEVGEEVVLFVTGSNGGTPVARVGDTQIQVADAPNGVVDTRVRLRIEEFDANDHVGRATYIESLGEETF